jgi:hypothetical protein
MVTPRVKTWVTRDGREIPLSQLTDQHLANIIRMLEDKGILVFEKYLLQKKRRRWVGDDAPETDEDVAVRVEGSLLGSSFNQGSIAKYHELRNEQDRRREAKIIGPYGNIDDASPSEPPA